MVPQCILVNYTGARAAGTHVIFTVVRPKQPLRNRYKSFRLKLNVFMINEKLGIPNHLKIESLKML